MNRRGFSALLISTVLPLMLYGAAASGKSEVKGAAILDHPCGKVAVKQMGLTHAGSSTRPITKEMQDHGRPCPPAHDVGLAKEMSETEAHHGRDRGRRAPSSTTRLPR